MTFAVSRDQGNFEWAGISLSSVFAQRSNIFKISMWRMLFDIVRFNQYALDLLSNEEECEIDPTGTTRKIDPAKGAQKSPHEQSIGEYLDQENYSEAFRNDYLIPMTAAVWSTSPDKCSLEFPAITLVRFMWNHHLLTTISARPPWRTIKYGSKQYIDAVMKDFPMKQVHLNTAVKSLQTQIDNRVLLIRSDGKKELYDHVIVATHGDQALKMISQTATPKEIEILSNFKTSTNTVSLHSDLSVSLPITRKGLLLLILTRMQAHAHPARYLVGVELYNDHPHPRSTPYGMPYLQHEHPPTYPDGNLWPRSCNSQPLTTPLPISYPGNMDIQSPPLQPGRHPCTELITINSKYARHQLCRCMD